MLPKRVVSLRFGTPGSLRLASDRPARRTEGPDIELTIGVPQTYWENLREAVAGLWGCDTADVTQEMVHEFVYSAVYKEMNDAFAWNRSQHGDGQ